MGFSNKQVGALRRGLNAAHVRTREAHGRELSYIEGWHAIAEANRIFGFEGWDRETVETRCVLNRELRGTHQAVYLAKIRITVHADGQNIVREGHGSGESRGASAGETHDMALKVAETDGTKRALATFGKPFGLDLYLSKRRAERRGMDVKAPSPSRERPARPVGIADPREHTPPQQEAPVDRDQTPLQPAPQRAQDDPPSVAGSFSLQAERFSALLSGVDKSALAIGYPRRYRDKGHLRFVASQPCLICSRHPSDAHHLRFAQTRAMSMKVSDEFTVPLCRTHHRQLHHSGNEIDWWEAVDRDIDPVEVAKGFWEQSRKCLLAAQPSRSAVLDVRSDD